MKTLLKPKGDSHKIKSDNIIADLISKWRQILNKPRLTLFQGNMMIE